MINSRVNSEILRKVCNANWKKIIYSDISATTIKMTLKLHHSLDRSIIRWNNSKNMSKNSKAFYQQFVEKSKELGTHKISLWEILYVTYDVSWR